MSKWSRCRTGQVELVGGAWLRRLEWMTPHGLGVVDLGTDIYLHAERREEGRWQNCGELEELEVRHYEFFAILANVWNPIRSTKPFEYITSHRGLPTDLSSELSRDGLLCSGHSPGWATLREL